MDIVCKWSVEGYGASRRRDPLTKINAIYTHLRQTCIAASFAIFGGAVGTLELYAFHHQTELGSQEDLVPLSGSFEPFSKHFFVVSIDARQVSPAKIGAKADSVLLGSVPEGLAQLQCTIEDSKTFFIVAGGAVCSGEHHQSETQGRDLWAISAQLVVWYSIARHD